MESIALRTANPNDRIALRGVRLRARIAGMAQRTTVEQTFVNLEPRAIEAVYTFPLPEGAAVCGFEVVTGDHVLTGTVEESNRAIEKYEEAIDEGHGAFLMEQERPDVFTVRVGNIKPRQAATIRLTYVCALERVDRQIRIAFPTTVAPRYVTATGADPIDAMIDGVALNPPHVLSVPYGLSIEAEVDLGRALLGVHSPSHSIRVERGADSRDPWTVTLAGGVTEMNRDVVLTIDLERETEPAVQVERGSNGESYLAVTFVPEFDEDELAAPEPAETVFVLDCSGSMQGDSIAQAIAALELCLRSLSPGDTFNVCRFGSSFWLMASEPLVYSQQTLDAALRYVRSSPDLGGTELYAPLEAIFNTPPRTGKVRQVILLTDGQVSNEPAVIELGRAHRVRNRLFTFGIGPASSAYLVRGLARATGGAAEFITAGERIDEKVLRTFGRLASPMVSDVAIDWGGADVQTLAELPPAFDGDVMAVFGRAPAKVPSAVTLSCRTAAGPKRWTVNVPPAGGADGAVDGRGVIATMWARRMIQSLEEVNQLHRSRAASAEQTRERQTLINLSKEFGLLCSLTTFIAIEHRSLEERNEGRQALRRVPVQLAEGWGGTQFSMAAGGAMIARCVTAPAPGAVAQLDADRLMEMADAAPAAAPKKRRRYAGGLGRLFKSKASNATDDGATIAAAAPAAPPRDDVHVLLSAQGADGMFADAPDVAGILNQHLAAGEAWRQWIAQRLPASVTDPSVVPTLGALLVLRSSFADRKPLWRRAHDKAVRALATALGWDVTRVNGWIDSLCAHVERVKV